MMSRTKVEQWYNKKRCKTCYTNVLPVFYLCYVHLRGITEVEHGYNICWCVFCYTYVIPLFCRSFEFQTKSSMASILRSTLVSMAIPPDAVVVADRARVEEQQAGPAWPVFPALDQRAVHHAVLGQAVGQWAQAGDHHDVGLPDVLAYF